MTGQKSLWNQTISPELASFKQAPCSSHLRALHLLLGCRQFEWDKLRLRDFSDNIRAIETTIMVSKSRGHDISGFKTRFGWFYKSLNTCTNLQSNDIYDRFDTNSANFFQHCLGKLVGQKNESIFISLLGTVSSRNFGYGAPRRTLEENCPFSSSSHNIKVDFPDLLSLLRFYK